MDPRLLGALVPLIETLEELGIEYQLGGSVASSVHGVARSSLDVDVLTSLVPEQVDALVAELEAAYYIPKVRALAAAKKGGSFNAIHFQTMFKVDVFVSSSNAFRRSSLERRKLEHLTEHDIFYVTSAEDIVLHKLHWFRNGGEVSERQWQDVLGVLTVKEGHLDMEYLDKWASDLEVRDLLERAIAEAART